MGKGLRQTAPDVIDVQGLWEYKSYVNYRHFANTGTPYLITPQGMLDPWALKRSRIKKFSAKLLYENCHLANAKCLRATSEREATEFRKLGLKNPIAIVPNSVQIPHLSNKPPITSRKRILFMGRIHPVKGIDYLLRAWGELDSEFKDWDLVIAGPDEIGYLAEMQEYAEKLNCQRIHWCGAVYGDAKQELYESCDLFVLPTHTENFGLVVAEALSYSLPVITTVFTPWSGLSDKACGWCIELNDDALQNSMECALASPLGELQQMGSRGRAWIESEFGLERVSDSMSQVYNWIALGVDQPGFVHE